MLCENIKNLRRDKGLSQEELAQSLHVVRQTVSKWENGLSVPDAEQLQMLAQALDCDLQTLLGETVLRQELSLAALAAELETVTFQLAEAAARRRRRWRICFAVMIILALCALGLLAAILIWQGLASRAWMENTAAIGGYNGPTQIQVQEDPAIWRLLSLLLLGAGGLAAGGIGLYQTRKRR